MALTGNLDLYAGAPTGNSESVTLTYPADLPENHSDYDKRGTSETIEVPEITVTTSSYADVYINVFDANISYLSGVEHELFSSYRIYGSAESRSLDKENYILQNEVSVGTWDWDNDTNPVSKTYTFLKSQVGWENLSDA